MPVTIFVHVFPKSFVLKMIGCLSPCWYRFAATKAPPAMKLDGSMIETRVKSPMSFGVTFSQFTPLLRDTQTSPSSVPAQSTPACTGDSSKAKISAYVSTPVWSRVIGPPDGPMVFGSFRARSGDTGVQLCPSFVDRNSREPAAYTTLGVWRENTIGNVHWKRTSISSDEWPIGLIGKTVTFRSKPVRRSFRVSSPP